MYARDKVLILNVDVFVTNRH